MVVALCNSAWSDRMADGDQRRSDRCSIGKQQRVDRHEAEKLDREVEAAVDHVLQL